MTGPDPHPDRDAHLLAALRHAPDRDVQPPPALSEMILRQAQAAVQRPAARAEPVTGRAAGFGAWFNNLLRPAPAAAFGTLAVAGIVGVMWTTQEPPGVTDEPPWVAVPGNVKPSQPVPDLTASTAIPAPTTTAAPAAETSQLASKQLAPPTDIVAKVAPPKPKPATPETAPQGTPAAAPQSAARRREALATSADSPPAAPAATVAAAPALSAPPAPAPMRAAEAAAPAAAAAPTAVRSTAEQPVARSAAAPALKSSTNEVARGSATLQRSMADAGGGSPLVSALAQLDAAGGGAQWTSPQGKTVTHSAAQQQWLAEINRSTTNAWRRVPDGMASPSDSASWSLRYPGGAIGSLWLEGTTLWWRDGRGLLFAASASEEQVRGWIEAAKNW